MALIMIGRPAESDSKITLFKLIFTSEAQYFRNLLPFHHHIIERKSKVFPLTTKLLLSLWLLLRILFC